MKWMIPMFPVLAALSLAAIGLIFRRWRNLVREKDRRIAQALREQDLLARELERLRIEKQTLERMLGIKLAVAVKTEVREETNENP